jgi:heavy metal sensor kinase
VNTRSIHFRLTVWYTALLTAVFALLGALLYVQLRHSLEAALLATQARRADQIAETLLARVDRTGVPRVVDEIKELYAPEWSDRFIRITRADGSVLYVSGPPSDEGFDPNTVPAAAPSPERDALRKQRLPGGGALLIAARRSAGADGGRYLVEVGASPAPIERMLQHLLLLLALGLPVVVLITVSGGYVLVRRALAPVERITGKAEGITHHNLSERLPVAHTGDELERLSLALNHMITRLDDAFRNSKRFVADASHELRTPLTVLRGDLEHLVRQASAPDLRDRLGSLLEEVERLTKIVERLFALSRLDAGEAQAEWVPVDLGELVSTTADQMSLLAEDKRIAIDWDTAQRVTVQGDRARLKQVVVNLLDNAIQYTPEGGAIHLRVHAANGHALLDVADTGVGIPSGAMARVFERFFRVDETRSREGGAGLGLAIVQSICHAHGGTVEVESAIGRGSRFRVRLPSMHGGHPE